ncbi:MAG: lytic transglycosylase domain-containing protein [Acidobacteria bacterium]|nr:lytic transglycosylase domain-containing protein [Acidobacteriota bacterium]
MKISAILLLALCVFSFSQVRIEKDANGNILITNSGSEAKKNSKPASKTTALPPISLEEKSMVKSKVQAACTRKALDYNLVCALIETESGFRHNVVSKKGAVGLMQLIPETAKRFGAKNVWDLDENIEAGTSFLSFLFTFFNNNIPLVLAGYNAGENAVLKYSNKIPPYSETVRYVFKILDKYGKRELTEKAKLLLASPSDYNRFYLSQKNKQPTYRILYMHINEQGNPSYTDYPPDGVISTPIYFKDE